MSMVDVDCHPCPSDGDDLLARPGYRPTGSNPRRAVCVSIMHDTGTILKVCKTEREKHG